MNTKSDYLLMKLNDIMFSDALRNISTMNIYIFVVYRCKISDKKKSDQQNVKN